MAAKLIGVFTKYTPAPDHPLSNSGAIFMADEEGVDLYDARDAAGPGLFVVTPPGGDTVQGIAPFPFVAFPEEGGSLWHIVDNKDVPPIQMLGRPVSEL